jgi:ribosome-binding factor A
VYVSVMGSEKEQSLCMHGLASARGFLQSKVGDRIQTRFTPLLTFVLDEGVKKSIEASRIIREALAESRPNEKDPEGGEVETG